MTKQLRRLLNRHGGHADRDEKMKIYVYTIPKAGTYFIADFLGRIGFLNTGYHVMANYFLDKLSAI